MRPSASLGRRGLLREDRQPPPCASPSSTASWFACRSSCDAAAVVTFRFSLTGKTFPDGDGRQLVTRGLAVTPQRCRRFLGLYCADRGRTRRTPRCCPRARE